MAKSLMVQGTASHAGKSTVVAGLCRLLSDAGYSVAPFKSQNMSLNSTVTPDGGEIAISQAVQARAARTPPRVEMNPVLLKPNGDTGSQVVVRGRPVGDMLVEEYYDRYDEWLRVTEECYQSLAADHDIVIAEGAGSPAEINIRDYANMPTARVMDAPVLLVADIERGGTFASLYGTLELLGDDADRVAAYLINKFRGDPDRLTPGLHRMTELTGTPCIGVLPHDDPGLPAEDSLSIRDTAGHGDVAVVRHRHASNVTDLDPLRDAGIAVRYVEPGDPLGTPDAVVLPGSKRTLEDLRDLNRAGLADDIRHLAGDVPIVGICGGYQMLGQSVTDHVECVGEEPGLGLLPVDTRFDTYDKTTTWTEVDVGDRNGLLRGVETLRGYEIHVGTTSGDELNGLGATANDGYTLGTYLHGLFHNHAFLHRFADIIGVEPGTTPDDPYDAAADLLRNNLDLPLLEDILGAPI